MQPTGGGGSPRCCTRPPTPPDVPCSCPLSGGGVWCDYSDDCPAPGGPKIFYLDGSVALFSSRESPTQPSPPPPPPVEVGQRPPRGGGGASWRPGGRAGGCGGSCYGCCCPTPPFRIGTVLETVVRRESQKLNPSTRDMVPLPPPPPSHTHPYGPPHTRQHPVSICFARPGP